MDIDKLNNTLTQEITTRVFEINNTIDTVNMLLSSLSTQAVELDIFFRLSKQIPLKDLANDCKIKPKELNELARGCKLTKTSPQINRALLSRFGIIP